MRRWLLEMVGWVRTMDEERDLPTVMLELRFMGKAIRSISRYLEGRGHF